MNIDEAKEECFRWFGYLKWQEGKVQALQKLAADRRRGVCSDKEAARRRSEIQGNGLTVYDGANLETAVRVILKELEAKQ